MLFCLYQSLNYFLFDLSAKLRTKHFRFIKILIILFFVLISKMFFIFYHFSNARVQMAKEIFLNQQREYGKRSSSERTKFDYITIANTLKN